MLGGDWGPNVLCAPGAAEENKIGPNGNIPGQIPRDIVLDGLYIHDQNSANLDQCHTGGLMVISADGLTIRNTTFSQTAVYDMSVGDFTRAGGAPAYGHPRRVLLENNWFGAPVEQDGVTNDEQPELQFSEDGLFDDWLIRFNSFHNGLRLAWDSGARWRNFRVIGNVGGTMDCNATDGNVRWEQNAWVDNPCTGADRRLQSLPTCVLRSARRTFTWPGARRRTSSRGRAPTTRSDPTSTGRRGRAAPAATRAPTSVDAHLSLRVVLLAAPTATRQARGRGA